MNKLVLPFVLVSCLCFGGCVTTDEGKGLQALEQMSDLEFNKWTLYVQLGVKIGANRLLQEKVVTVGDLEVAASAIEAVRDQTGVPIGKSFIKDALEGKGLTSDEIELLLVIVEQELIARGALDWVNPETGLLELSPRTKGLLTVVATALRSASVVSEEEVQQGKTLETQFNGKLVVGQGGPGKRVS